MKTITLLSATCLILLLSAPAIWVQDQVVSLESVSGKYVVAEAGSGRAPAAQGDFPTENVIRQFLPEIHRATSENCVAPLNNGAAEAMYFVQPHPDNPDGAVLVSVSIVMLEDCGLAGHESVYGADGHLYDSERFLMTLVRGAACGNGWRLHSIKTRAHASEFTRHEINERVIGGGCEVSPLVMSLGKHALYTSWVNCTRRTPAEVCTEFHSNLPALRLNLHNVSDIANAREVLKNIPGFQYADAKGVIPDGWNESFFHPEQSGKLKGLPNPYNVANDHDCPYGADWDAGLCYPKCKDGYTGHLTDCWQRNCPAEFHDVGALCGKPSAYGRGVGYKWEFGDGLGDSGMRKRCEKAHGQGNCEKSGPVFYPKCKSNFHAVACCICSPDCPSGMKDLGGSCGKKTYDRGSGVRP